MITIQGKKVSLTEATIEDIAILYYWKFEEEKQEAKNGMVHISLSHL